MKRLYRIAVVWDFNAHYGEGAVQGVASFCQQSSAFEFPILDQADTEIPKILSDRGVDGMLVYGQGPIRFPKHPAKSNRIPIVSLETCESTITPYRILPDNHAVGRLVAKELLQRGFRHLVYCPSEDAAWDHERREGFVQAAVEAGIAPTAYTRPSERMGNFEREWTGPLADWLRELPRPVGIMGANDSRARHLVLAMQTAGIRAAQDAAVIGVDNHPAMALMGTGISSVELDSFRAGYAACRMLHQLMEGITIDNPIVRIPPLRLFTRQSSDVLAINDLDVIQAVHFIAENATRGIDVEHVVAAVPLSRRSLERRFQLSLNCSIREKIRAAQLDRAKLLLADRSVPLNRIARLCGFVSAKSFGGIFDRFVGVSPSGYRARVHARPAKS